MNRTRSIVMALFSLTLIGCAPERKQPGQARFRSACSRLNITEPVAATLWEFRTEDPSARERYFEFVYEFLGSRQLWRGAIGRPRESDRLATTDVKDLLGEPQDIAQNGEWRYYFRANGDWYITLEFLDGVLAHAGRRQLLSREELATNNALHGTAGSRADASPSVP